MNSLIPIYRASAVEYLTCIIRNILPLGINGNTCCCSQGVILNKSVLKLEKNNILSPLNLCTLSNFTVSKILFFHQVERIFFLVDRGWKF